MNSSFRAGVALGMSPLSCATCLAIPPQDQVNAVLWHQRRIEYEAAAKQAYWQARTQSCSIQSLTRRL